MSTQLGRWRITPPARRFASTKPRPANVRPAVWRKLQALMDAQIAKATGDLDGALAALLGTDIPHMSNLILSGQTGQAMALFNMEGAPHIQYLAQQHMAHLMLAVAQEEAANWPDDAGYLRTRFDLINLQAVAYANDRSAKLVTNISGQLEQTIQFLVAATTAGGDTVEGLARRLAPLVGLTEAQARAVERLAAGMADAGYTEAQIRKRVEAEAERRRKQRAKLIATTELADAATAGQAALWEQGFQTGTLDRDRARYRWIVTGDGKTCPICRPLDDMRVKPGEAFDSPRGPIVRPPAHPGCRCAWSLVMLDRDDPAIDRPAPSTRGADLRKALEDREGSLAAAKAAWEQAQSDFRYALARRRDNEDRYQAALARVQDTEAAYNGVLSGIRGLLAADNPATFKHKYVGTGATKGKKRDDWQDAIQFVRSITDASKTRPDAQTKLLKDSDRRAYYWEHDLSVHMNAIWSDAGTMAHELGHWIEWGDPNVRQSVQDFLNRRTMGEQPQKLADLFPGYGYRDNEIVKLDKFAEPYMGKIYAHGSTEILSMGIEQLYRDPIGFAKSDPDYFDFIITVLQVV